jgi:hypothetical protein
MNINTFAFDDKDMLLEIATAWEAEYYQTHKTDRWKGYVQIMGILGKVNDIPKKDGLRAHLGLMASMETS